MGFLGAGEGRAHEISFLGWLRFLSQGSQPGGLPMVYIFVSVVKLTVKFVWRPFVKNPSPGQDGHFVSVSVASGDNCNTHFTTL